MKWLLLILLMPNPADALIPEQKSEIYRLARIESARRAAKGKNILLWGKRLMPEKFDLPFCQEMHQYFVDIRHNALTNTEAPRNHAKTTIKCNLIPLFQALEEPETFRHYLNIQSTDKKALAVNTAIKLEIEENQEIRELYGDVRGGRWTDEQFILKVNGRQVIFSAKGAGSSLRGINYRNIRPDYIIVDDLYDEDDINNPEATIKKNKWFWGSLYPARAKGRRNSIHLQGTAINTEDLLHKQKDSERWESQTFAAIKDEEKEIVLWPELNSYADLMADKFDMGSVIFYREMQNERRDDESSIIKESWLRSWEYDPIDFNRELSDGDFKIVDVILGFDPSIGKTVGRKVTSDASGAALIYKTQYADAEQDCFDYWIDGLWEQRLSMDKRIKLCSSIHKGQPDHLKITKANVEGIAGFLDFVAQLRKRTTIPVKEISQVKDKITNLENKSRHFENGKVHLNRNIEPALKKTIYNQLTTNKPKHDDVRDGVLLCLDDKATRLEMF